MSDILKVNGIVLAAYPLGENDKSLTVLTTYPQQKNK